MKAIIAVLMAFYTVFVSIFSLGLKAEAPADTSDFVPVVRFTVASDTHTKVFVPERTKRIQKTLMMGYDIAEKSKTYNKLDACLFVGDVTDNGFYNQFAVFGAAVNSVIKDETQLLAVVAKSHDSGTHDKKSIDAIEYLTGKESDFHCIINGFHFIGLSTCKTDDVMYEDYQRTWLSGELKKASQDDPNKPIFLMHHEHVAGTVYGSLDGDGWGTDYFKDIISQYPQIIDFSGHSHYPLNDPRSIWQGEFTAVGTGALNYAEFTVDGERCVHPEGYKEDAQIWVVEADANNRIRLRGMDLLTDSVLCEYIINNPADADNRQYTPEKQKKAASAPEFLNLTFTNIKRKKDTVTLTFDAAESTDGYPVFLYRFIVCDENGSEISDNYLLDKNWTAKCYQTVTYSVNAKSGQTIKVYAENSFGMRSEPITYKIK